MAATHHHQFLLPDVTVDRPRRPTPLRAPRETGHRSATRLRLWQGEAAHAAWLKGEEARMAAEAAQAEKIARRKQEFVAHAAETTLQLREEAPRRVMSGARPL